MIFQKYRTNFFYKGFFVVFVVMYISTVAFLFYRSLLLYKRADTPQQAKSIVLVGMAVYASSFLFLWLPDLFLCQYVFLFNINFVLLTLFLFFIRSHTQWMHFHAWFHLCSAVGPYAIITFLCYERSRRIQKNSSLRYLHVLGIIPLPYVEVHSLETVKSE